MNGVLIVNKDLGYTSRDVVNVVSKHIGTKKVGHTGTLDPNATGVLVICVGKALKLCELLTEHDKEYIADGILGLSTDTLDMMGKVIESKIVNITRDEINTAIKSFKGEYLQEVPMFSAVKINGKKMYEYARNNIKVEVPSRMVNIKEIELCDDIRYDDGKIFFKIKCTVSKGTYIRSLIRDIGRKLNCPAVMSSLIRTRQGNFTIDKGYTIGDIKNNNFNLIKIEDAFPDIPRIIVDDDVAFRIKNGMIMDKFFDGNMVFIFDNDNRLLALYRNVDNNSRVYRMFV